MNILVVDDNPQIMATLCDYLELGGHLVDCARHGDAALERLRHQHVDVIIMDIMMPRRDGISTVQQIRQHLHLDTPVLFLTARDQLDDKIAAFEAGGDDYLIKPFALQELQLRLQALARRGRQPSVGRLQLGPLCYDLQQQQVSLNKQAVHLSPIRLQILRLLMQQYPAMVNRQQLLNQIWGDNEPDSDALRSHIHGLRCALREQGKHDWLETVHGQGYRLVCP